MCIFFDKNTEKLFEIFMKICYNNSVQVNAACIQYEYESFS